MRETAAQTIGAPDAIVLLGDARLRAQTAPVERDDALLRDAVSRMRAALADARARLGFGRALSAPQIGVPLRVIVVDLGAGPFAVLNPEIVWRSDDTFEVWDDCLSIPDRVVRVRRNRSISIRFRDDAFRPRLWEHLPADLSELMQHEIDHLDGVLMIERAVGQDAERPISDRASLIDATRSTHRLSLDSIREASSHIDSVFLRTPQFICERLAQRVGCRLTLKVETLNPIRSFKGRGADYFVTKTVERSGAGPMVCASAGNFGQAMAYSCKKHGIPITVFVSENASAIKVSQMRALGADVRHAGATLDEAKEVAKRWATENGVRFVEDGQEPLISEGAGTIAVELLASGEAYDDVVVPIGDGALINGIARWLKAASPTTRVIGACSRAAPALAQAWRRGAGLQADVETAGDTIADSIAIHAPISTSVADMQNQIDDIILVDDATLIEGMRMVHSDVGIVAEPAGVAGLAAILTQRNAFANRNVVTVITGGNVTTEHLSEWGVFAS